MFIILLGTILVFTFLIGHTVGLLLLFLYIVAMHLVYGVSRRGLLKNARKLIGFVLLVVVINAFLVRGTPLLPWFSVFSREGLGAGIYYSMRVVVLYFAIFLFLSVTSQEGIAKGLSSLVKPVSARWSRRIALYGFLSIGFLPLFGSEVERIRMAQRFRGGGFEGGLVQRLAGARMLIVPLLVSAIHRSDQLAMAVELRGIKRSIGHILHVGKPSYGDFFFSVMTLVVVLIAFSL
ncbi:MAG: energy-coupling factor transporter transmembrane protein EcfT [Candidatus Krumholzibacteria bacterium]|nr:energy-coupling factor transporter transmembrane protein EcfT [Candidatus Krumholzibacteria bacterium]